MTDIEQRIDQSGNDLISIAMRHNFTRMDVGVRMSPALNKCRFICTAYFDDPGTARAGGSIGEGDTILAAVAEAVTHADYIRTAATKEHQ
jgi:hypothetical protein